MSTSGVIRVIGARQHNLKNVSVTIPRGAMTVITGLSGSGKSSLAFDTVYAEGERRYVESLSAYARQFLEQMPKPDVDRIEGLSPTIAVEQRAASTNPRSTVATTTEIYDYLRVLFSRVGKPYCWVCHELVSRQTIAEMVDAVLAQAGGSRVLVLSPRTVGKKGDLHDLLDEVSGSGYVRVRIGGEVFAIEDLHDSDVASAGPVEIVVDRIVLKRGVGGRLADSLELALRLSGGRAAVSISNEAGVVQDQAFSETFSCAKHPEVNIPELSPRMFSFNSPYGACSACSGLGTVLEFDADLIVPNRDLSLVNGAIAAWRQGGQRMNTVYAKLIEEFCRRFDVPPEIPYRNLSAPLNQILLQGTSRKEAKAYGHAFEGVIPSLKKRWESTDSESVKHRLHQFQSEAPCRACQGARLRPESLAVHIGGRSISDVCVMDVATARKFFDELSFTGQDRIIAEQPLREIRNRLAFLEDVGVEYLSLSRSSGSLSGGEVQRIRLATQIGSDLTGMCYVLDEPTIGLHQRDTARLVTALRRLARIGNAVLVVEHDEEVIEAADHIIDVGPGAGAHGGEILHEGSLEALKKNERSVTAQYLTGRQTIPLPTDRRPVVASHAIEIRGASANNLQDLTVRFPLSCLVCVTGVSGSGKSTLVGQTLLPILRRRIDGSGPRPGKYDQIVGGSRVDRVIEIDQAPIGRTPRSNPATYVGVFDLIRRLFARTREAKIRGYGPGRFSFNVKGGRCEECQGQGTRRIEMHFLPDVFVECGSCRGTRYNRETLEVRYRGKSIADVLDMRVEEAALFFQNFSKIRSLLRALIDVGMGYVSLGQSSVTLSGGEAQRVKLAAELGKPTNGHTLYVLDEPTTGLHFADIHKLVHVLNRLVNLGHTIVVIEHNLDVIKMADWVIDLGPEGGAGGGRIVAEGRPEDIAGHRGSHTGRYLQAKLGLKRSTAVKSSRGRKRVVKSA